MSYLIMTINENLSNIFGQNVTIKKKLSAREPMSF